MPVPFKKLDRRFARLIERDASPWGTENLSWATVLLENRVVLLAESGSGKTSELRDQVTQLRQQNYHAFHVECADLFDVGLLKALPVDDAERFSKWLGGLASAWFFLDAADQMPGGTRSLPRILRQLHDAMGTPGLERSRILIACKAGAWRGHADNEVVGQNLPPFRPESTFDNGTPAVGDPPGVVRMEPLNLSQMTILASAAGVRNVSTFIDQINDGGLAAYAERPGDLIYLAASWNAHGRLSTHELAVEEGIRERLRESESGLPDQFLSLAEAVRGAERLAAMLCLAQRTVFANSRRNSEIAVDPRLVLREWTETQLGSLFSRGLFVQTSLGHFQIHHPSSQHYLAARWFHSLLKEGRGLREIRRVFFPTTFGVPLVAAHLSEVACWLTLWHPKFQQELATRDPNLLLQPAFFAELEPTTRQKIWVGFERQYANGDATFLPATQPETILLGDPLVEQSVRRSWQNDDTGMTKRRIMQIVQRGKLAQYRDLVMQAASQRGKDTLLHSYAILAAVSLRADDILRSAVASLVSADAGAYHVDAGMLAGVLYPRYLSRQELVQFLWVQDDRKTQEEPLGRLVDRLSRILNGDEVLAELLHGVLDDIANPPPDTAAYLDIAKRLVEPLAGRVALDLQGRKPTQEFQELLDRLELARHRPPRDKGPIQYYPLEHSVSQNHWLNRHSFWKFVGATRPLEGVASADALLKLNGDHLWRLQYRDLQWLYLDLFDRAEASERRLVLSVIVAVLDESRELVSEAQRLRDLVTADAGLKAQLFDELKVRLFLLWDRSEQTLYEEIAHWRDEAEGIDPESDWTRVRERLRSDPSILRERSERGRDSIWEATRWLAGDDEDLSAAAVHWTRLETEVGRAGAEAYRDGAKACWRFAEGADTTVRDDWLIWIGFAAEKSGDPLWAEKLSLEETRKALAILTEAGVRYTHYLDDLLAASPTVAVSSILVALKREWLRRPTREAAPFLYHFATVEGGPPHLLAAHLLDLLTLNDAPDPSVFEMGIGILQRLVPGSETRLFEFAIKGFAAHSADLEATVGLSALSGEERSAQFMLLALSANAGDALAMLRSWLARAPKSIQPELTEYVFCVLSGEAKIRQSALMEELSVGELRELLEIFLEFFPPPTATLNERTAYRPDYPFEVEWYRSRRAIRSVHVPDRLLLAIYAQGGPTAYQTLLSFDSQPRLQNRSPRPRELARALAGEEGLGEPWTTERFLAFEADHPPTPGSGGELFGAVVDLLDAIAIDLSYGDFSVERSELAAKRNEEKVQKWLAAELNQLARGRFTVVREAQVRNENRPDLIASTATAQVAIEVKQAEHWSANTLLAALNKQLAHDYLLPLNRRHGVLVITNHHSRKWQHPDTGTSIGFGELVRFLQSKAGERIDNPSGGIVVDVRGLDLSVA